MPHRIGILAALAAIGLTGVTACAGQDGSGDAAARPAADPPVVRIYELKRDAGRYIGRTVTLEGLVGEMLRGGYVDVGAGAQDVIAITRDRATRIENGPVREGKPVRTSGRVEWARDHLLARTPFTFQTPEGPELRSDYSGEPVLIAEEIEVLDVDPADFPKQVGGEPY